MKRALLAVPLALGCATKSLPPGTPPPEYEQRSFEPWPKTAVDAGSDAAPAEPTAPSEPPPPSAAPAANDGDAGPGVGPY